MNSYLIGERPAAVARWLAASRPLTDAVEAGVEIYWIGEHEIYISLRPFLAVDDRQRLHNASGPAVHWTAPDGERYYFWHGVRVAQHVIEHPEKITTAEIEAEGNSEIRRVMVERYGLARYLDDSGAVCVNRDVFGELYRKRQRDDEDLVMVKVMNSTPEPDGTIKPYFLRVPPHMRTAHEAVAWTFGMKPQQYQPLVQT